MIPYTQQAYSRGQGTSPITAFKFEDRDPTPYDTTPVYELYQGWVNTVTKAIWYLEAFLPINGVITSQWRAVGPIVVATTNPTTADYLYPIGQTWINTAAEIYWGLVNVTNNIATWEDLSSGTATGILTLTGNTGGAVAGDGSRNINTVGAGGITIAGNSGTHTLTTSLAGGGYAIESIEVDTFTAPGTDPVVPTNMGLMTVTGGQIPAGSTANVIRTDSLAANTYTIQVQRSNVSPASNASLNGVAHFNNADFTIDNNAFVSLASPGNTAFTAINIQVITSTGTYTPTTGMKYCIVEIVGGGGAGGGCASTGGGDVSCGSGGGGGEYALGLFTAAQIGASKPVTIGLGGLGVSGTTGNPGTQTTFSSLMSAFPGLPGMSGFASTPGAANAIGGSGGTGGTGGTYHIEGQQGFYAWGIAKGDVGITIANGGDGGDTQKGNGGNGGVNDAGTPGLLYGGGGGGPANTVTQGAQSGGNGADGVCIITEYI